jgi:hypothetical protein
MAPEMLPPGDPMAGMVDPMTGAPMMGPSAVPVPEAAGLAPAGPGPMPNI